MGSDDGREKLGVVEEGMKAEKPPRWGLRAREGRRDEFSSPLSKE